MGMVRQVGLLLIVCSVPAAMSQAAPLRMAGPVPEGDPVVVNPDGSGHVPTIQAGLARIEHLFYVERVRSPLHIMPGEYDEAVWIPASMDEGRIFGVGGRDRTRIRSIAFERNPDQSFGLNFEFDGLSIVEPVEASGRPFAAWRNCRFEGGFWSLAIGELPGMSNCEFLARSVLRGFTRSAFEGLVFRDAPLWVGTRDGPVRFEDCTFEGAADSAVTISPTDWLHVHFDDCRFTGVQRGIIVDGRTYSAGDGVSVTNCSFTDVGTGIEFEYDVPHLPKPGLDSPGPGLVVTNSEFSRVGTAIRWLSPNSAHASIRDVIVRETSGPAIELSFSSGAIGNTTIRNAGGDGILLAPSSPPRLHPQRLEVLGCDIRDVRGDGIRLEDAADSDLSVWIQNNVVARSGGAGISVRTLPGLSERDAHYTIARNTVAMSGGHGIEARPDRGARAGILRNLAAGNDGAGILAEGVPPDSVRFNNAWRNAGGNHVGFVAGSDELSVDPGFCDAAGEDFHVQTGSPVGESGPYGLIGALGVGCDASRVPARLESRHPVNPAGNAPVRVTLIGHPLIDVERVLTSSVRLAGAYAEAAKLLDVTGDGLSDLDLRFRARGMSIDPNHGDSLLSGTTLDGLALYGRVPLRVVPAHIAGVAAGTDAMVESIAIRDIRLASDDATVLVRARLRIGIEAKAELFDIAGRRIGFTRFVPPGSGVHEVEIRASAAGPGVVFVRLQQGVEVATARIRLVR